MSCLVMPPMRQMIGISHFGSALFFAAERGAEPDGVAVADVFVAGRAWQVSSWPGCFRERLLQRDLFGFRQPGVKGADQGGGDRFGCLARQQGDRQLAFFVQRRLGQRRVGQQALLVAPADFLRLRRIGPGRADIGGTEQHLRPAAFGCRDQDDAHALTTRPAGAAGAVQQGFLVGRQVKMDDQVKIGKIEAAGGNVGCDADLGAAVAQRLQRAVALVLRELAGEARPPRNRVPAACRAGRRTASRVAQKTRLREP